MDHGGTFLKLFAVKCSNRTPFRFSLDSTIMDIMDGL